MLNSKKIKDSEIPMQSELSLNTNTQVKSRLFQSGKTIKLSLILLTCFVFAKQSNAQSSITFDASQVFSTFKFEDSEGKTDKKYSRNITSAFNLGYLYSSKKGLLIGVNVGLRKAGATKEINNVSLIWNLQYAEAKLGIGYMLKAFRIRPFVMAYPYYSNLLKASQTLGDITLNIKSDDAIEKYDIGVIGTGGISAKLSDFISIYASYNYIYGIKNIETSPNQKLYNRGSSISLGLALTIIKSKAKWIQL